MEEYINLIREDENLYEETRKLLKIHGLRSLLATCYAILIDDYGEIEETTVEQEEGLEQLKTAYREDANTLLTCHRTLTGNSDMHRLPDLKK